MVGLRIVSLTGCGMSACCRLHLLERCDWAYSRSVHGSCGCYWNTRHISLHSATHTPRSV